MKQKLLFAVCLACMAMASNGQAPNAIPYQAVARDNSGNIIANQNISLRFSIHNATVSGTVVYSETQSATSNSLGLFSVNVGQGIVISGTFSSIAWNSGNKFLQVEMDPTGLTNYINMGTQQMLSVPYALSSADNKWTVSGNDIFNNNTGNVGLASVNTRVGIATLTPVSQLDIRTLNVVTSNTAFGNLSVLTTDPEDIDIGGSITLGGFKGISGQLTPFATLEGRKANNANGNSNGYLSFKTNINNVLAERLRITDAGLVGIGTSAPASRLNVEGNGGTTVLLQISDDVNVTKDSVMVFTAAGRLGIGTTGPVSRFNLEGNGSAAAELMRISNDKDATKDSSLIFNIAGNLGVGTAGPTAKLDVGGTFKLGSTGTVLASVIKATVSTSNLVISANSTAVQTYTVANTVTGSTVSVSPASGIASGLVIAYTRVASPGVVEIAYRNTTAANVTLAAGTNLFATIIQ